MKFQLLPTLTVATIFTLISGLPTSNTDNLNLLTKRSTLYCHHGVSADICESQYGASCDDYGEIFTPNYPADGESCTSRYCYCW